MKKKEKLSNIVKIIIILILYRSIATSRQGIFTVTYWDKYIYGILCCCVLFLAIIYENDMKFKFKKEQIRIILLIMFPIIIFWIYTMIINLWNPNIYEGFFTRSLSNVLFPLLAIIQGLLMYIYFKDKSIDIAFFIYALGFFTSIIIAFINGGVNEFYRMIFDSTFNGSVLEMSELSPTFSIFLLFYLYQYKNNNEHKKKIIFKILLCIVFLILGMKRILILSSLIICLIYLFLNKRVKNISFWTRIITACIILVIYVYIWGIKSEVLIDLFKEKGINTMSRTQLWRGIRKEYFFSPLYTGKGMGFVSKWMDNNWQGIGIIGLTQTTGLHNDLLKYYIELGFIGFLVYIYYILNVITQKIRKTINNESAMIYFLCMILQILCWFTDNISGFHIFMWIFYLILFYQCSNNKGSETNE